MSTDSKQAEPLLGQETEELRSRWQSIQSGFVDEPQEAVQQADALVTDVIERLTRTFQETRESLETQLGETDGVSTEDLRVGLQRYRTFFERLLTA
jgi:hypothetical protein